MTDKKISALPAATTPLTGTELVPIVQGGVTDNATVANLTAGRAVSVLSLTSTNDASIAGMTVGYGGGANSTNTAVGYRAINANASGGGYCVGLGYFALYRVTTGIYNVATGFDCLSGVTTGATNTAMGGASGNSLISGSNNGFWGFNAQPSATGVSNEYTYGDANVTAHRFTGGNLVPLTAGKGMNFTANTPAAGMTSQLLNWYEEGTWTPTIKFGGASVGITYSQQLGRYTRIGNQITIWFDVRLSAKGSSVGDATINGLPWVINANCTSTGIADPITGMVGLVAGGAIILAPAATVSYIYLFQQTTTARNLMSDANFNNTGSLGGSVTYFI